ncbi:MAG TPA: hydrogenase assembly protein HupF [Trebonia sp.]|jgi:hydrogenase expression/formation protein HypC|nr:hydrogenase assembly protein HupF [Trebonia sp.]
MTGEPPTRPDCTGDHCVTCGDVAVQVRVVRLLPDDLAVVDTGRGWKGGESWEGGEIVSVALVPAAAGDTILVHGGEAIAVVRAAIP